jgi:FliI/YscN family ATPase
LSVAGFPAPLGAVCEVGGDGTSGLEAEVIGFHNNQAILFPLGTLEGVRPGSRVRLCRSTGSLRVGDELLGRVIDGRGRVIDGRPDPVLPARVAVYRAAPPAMERSRITTPLSTGIRVIDGLLTCASGGRIGIFSGSGVGKSVLLGSVARHTAADVNVVALVGERGREVREFLERELGAEGLARSVVVVATNDEPALMRLRAAFVATAVAEYFRDRGNDVLLMMDSVTRVAYAQREIGLAAGEPPATRGYPPSVFALLARLLERSGRSRNGSITGLYAVLVEGDDANEPISDAVRSILDGHLWLSRKLANRGQFPAVDVLASVSRLMPDVVELPHREAAASVRELLAAYDEAEDLISIGAYQNGSNAVVDQAIQMREAVLRFMRQERDERSNLQEARAGLAKLAQARQQMDAARKATLAGRAATGPKPAATQSSDGSA